MNKVVSHTDSGRFAGIAILYETAQTIFEIHSDNSLRVITYFTYFRT
jgi:hypothetical protein